MTSWWPFRRQTSVLRGDWLGVPLTATVTLRKHTRRTPSKEPWTQPASLCQAASHCPSFTWCGVRRIAVVSRLVARHLPNGRAVALVYLQPMAKASNPPTRRPSIGWMRRLAPPVAILAFVASLWPTWANEPLRRRLFVARTPIQLVPGATATARFTPQRSGRLRLALRVEAGGDSERLWDLVGSRFEDSGNSLPMTLVYELRTSTTVVGSATKDEPISQVAVLGATLLEFAAHQVAEAQLFATVSLIAVPPELAGLSAEFVAGPSGDWIGYAWLEALVRQAVLGVLAIAAVIWLVVASSRVRSNLRRERLLSP